MTTPDGQTYIDAMASAAGFVLDYHMLMARHDVGVPLHHELLLHHEQRRHAPLVN